MKKRILVFSLVYLPDFVGGAEVAIDNIIKNNKDIIFDIITLRMSKKLNKIEEFNNVHIYRIGPSINNLNINKLSFKLRLAKIFFPIIALIKAISLSKKNEYDIVWSMMANQAGFAGLFYKKIYSKKKFILSLQEGDPIDDILKKVRPVRKIFKKIFTSADKVQVISNYLKNWALQMNVKENDVVVIPNGVDLNIFKNSNENIVENFDKYEIVTASRLVHKNGLRDLILSLTFLPEKYSLNILGEGPQRDELEKLVEKNNLSSRVFFRGYLRQQDMIVHLNRAGIFCRPSITEGLGNVFIEAMAAGLPVLATKVGGIPDIVFDYENGLFVEVENPESIAKKVEELNSNDALRERLIRNGKKYSNEFDWKIVSDKMKNLFNNC